MSQHAFSLANDDEVGGQERGPRGAERRHVTEQNLDSPGLYCLDEPEAALSFSSVLTLVGLLDQLARSGAQVLCATHSPVLAALPGATILEVGDWGLRRTTWEDLVLVQNWRSYLSDPQRYLRHILGD